MEDDEDLKESVRQVLQSHTDGVALHEFAEVYQVCEAAVVCLNSVLSYASEWKMNELPKYGIFNLHDNTPIFWYHEL